MFKPEMSAPSNLESNIKLLRIAGALNDGTWKSFLISGLRLACLALCTFHFFTKVLLMYDKESLFVTVEVLHWIILSVALFIGLANYIYHSNVFLEMDKMLKNGFYDYDGHINEKQLKMREQGNRETRMYTKMVVWSNFLSVPLQYLKGPFLKGNWSLPDPMWLPFEVNSWSRYSAAMIWSCIIVEPIPIVGSVNWLTYITMSTHLIAQYRILIVAIQEIDDLRMTGRDMNKQLAERVKRCVKHHQIILKFFANFQKYYGVSLLSATFAMAMMLCTLGFILISPQISMAEKGPVFILLVPEFMFLFSTSILGQLITDLGEEVGLAVYKTNWYTMPLSVQRDLLMMLNGTKKKNQLTAFGIQEYSKKGLTEILRATFTYLNVLSVLINEK